MTGVQTCALPIFIGNPFVDTDHFYNREFIKLLHLGIKSEFSSNYYKIKASRRINIEDDILYKIILGKKIKNNLDLNIFIANNSDSHGLGMGISYIFE